MATALDKVALALSDPIRLKILDLLAAGRNRACCSPANPDSPIGLCSCDLQPILHLTPSRLSYHTNQLKEVGLIVEHRRGRWVYFSLNQQPLVDFQRTLQERFLDPVAETAASDCCLPRLIQIETEI